MPFGAYKINSWGGNLNDAPVIPNGLGVFTWNQALATLTYTNPTLQNYNNQIAVLGVNGTGQRLYFVVANGGSTTSYTSVITAQTGSPYATTRSDTASNTSQSNNEVTTVTSIGYDYNNTGLCVSSWNQGATPTEVRNNSLYIANWQTNSAGTSFSGGNTTLGVGVADADKCKTITINTGARSLLVTHNAATNTNYVKTWTYSATGAFTAQLNNTNTNTYEIKFGIRSTGFYDNNTSINNIIYLGYSASNNIYIGSILTNGTAAPSQSAYDSGIAYTSKNAMLCSIYNNWTESQFMAAILHSENYIRFVKTTAFGSSFTSSYTQSQDFRIGDVPSSWYRICATRIDGLGALVYYEPTEGSFYLKFFTIDTAMTTLTWGNPIQLNANGVADMVLMNADVKWTNAGFLVGIVASNGTGNNQCYMSLLWPEKIRTFATQPRYQNSWIMTLTNNTMTVNPAASNPFNSTGGRFSITQASAATGAYIRPAVTNWNPNYNIGTGDFTYEYWFFNGFSLGFVQVSHLWLSSNTYLGLTTGSGPVYRFSGQWNGSGFGGAPKPPITINVWHHVAAVRQSGQVNIYLDGSLYAGPFSDTRDWNTSNFVIYLGNNNITASAMGGLSMSEFRLSNVARYSGSSFTVPTARFRNDVNTLCLNHFTTNNVWLQYNILDDWGPNYFE